MNLELYKLRTLFLWLAVIIFIGVVFAFYAFKNPVLIGTKEDTALPGIEPVEISNSEGSAASVAGESQTPPPVPNPPPAAPNQAEGTKTYKSDKYEFEFTYPASFGQVIIKNDKCPKGVMTTGTFANNPAIDFGFVSADYEKCKDNGFLLFETWTYDLLDNKLRLYSSNSSTPSVEVDIEQTISTSTPNIFAYIIKNTLEAGATGNAAAMLRSPNPGIGMLVFRTHQLSYQDGVKLLETIIQ